MIEKEAVSDSYIENLVIKIDNSLEIEEVSAYIIKYLINNGEITNEKELTNLFGRYSQNCSTACSPMCSTGEGADHVMYGPGCFFSYWGECTTTCDGGGIVGGENNNEGFEIGGGSTGGSGGGSATPQDTIAAPNNDGAGSGNEVNELIVALVEDEPNNQDLDDPCKNLKNLIKTQDSIFIDEYGNADTIKSPKLRQELIDIRFGVLKKRKEYGIELKYTKNINKYENIKVDTTLGTSNNVPLGIGYFYYGGIHTHPVNTVKIPSFGDLVWLRNCYTNAIKWNKNKVVLIIIVKNPNGTLPATYTYALKIDNYDLFTKKINDFLATYPSNLTEKQKFDLIHKEEGILYQNQTAALEQLFLNKYSSFGFSLYKANDTLTNWGKLTTNGTTTVTNNPCNP